jgi:hypothetical protein
VSDEVAEGAIAHGFIRIRGTVVARLFRELRCDACRAEPHGIAWEFGGGLLLYLPDRPAMPDLPFELSIASEEIAPLGFGAGELSSKGRRS